MNNLLDDIKYAISMPDKHTKEQLLELLEKAGVEIRSQGRGIRSLEEQLDNERKESQTAYDRIAELS